MSDLHTRIARAVGAIECEKVMSRHVYWHAAGIHRWEYEQYWSKRINISWGHGFGRQMDRFSYYNSYVLQKEANAFKSFLQTREKYPDVVNCEFPEAIAEYANHLTTTPIIEVAEDGMSAKGLWYTPGFIDNHCGANGQIRSQALWERYGGDFIYEDGRWVYTSLQVCPDIGGSVGGGGFAYRKRNQGPPPDAKAEPGKEAPKKEMPGASGMLEPFVPGPLFKEWSTLTLPQTMPGIPEPYTTEKETWHYDESKTLTD